MVETFVIKMRTHCTTAPDHCEIVGVVVGTCQEADAILDKMNANEPESYRRTFIRTYGQPVLTLKNCLD